MALEPHPLAMTVRRANEVREALDAFLEDPTVEAREADVVARMTADRIEVSAGRLLLPRVIHRSCFQQRNERIRK